MRFALGKSGPMDPRISTRCLALFFLIAMFSFAYAQAPGNGNGNGNGNGIVASNSSSSGAINQPTATARPSTTSAPAPIQNGTTTNSTTLPVSAAATPTLPPSPSATSPAKEQSNDSLPLDTKIDGAFAVLGVVLILTGASTALFGHRNRWSSFFMCGFYILALSTVCAILSLGVEKGVNPPSANVRGLFLLACLVAGIVGGAIFVLFYTWAAFAVCGLGGFALGLWLQALKSNGLIESLGLRWILLAGCTAALFAAGCIPRMHNAVVLVATAFSGSTALLLGIDCFSRAGIKEFYIRNLGFQALFADKYPPTFQDNRFPLVSSMQVELGVMAAVAAMGIAFQSRLYIIARERINQIRDADRDRKFQRAADKAALQISRTTERDRAEWEARYATGEGRKQAEHSPLWEQPKPSEDSSAKVILPRLWFSSTTLQNNHGSDTGDIEKNALGTETTIRPTTAKSTQSSFMSYVNGNLPPPVRGSFGRRASEQSSGFLPAVDTGKAFSPPIDVGKRSRAPSLRPKVAEERDAILTEIARIRATISELKNDPLVKSASSEAIAVERRASLSGPLTLSTMPHATAVQPALSASMDGHKHHDERHQSQSNQFMPVSSKTFDWIHSQPQPPVSTRSHSAHHSHEEPRGRPASMVEHVITGPTRSRGVSQDMQPAKRSAHTKSMSIDELQALHRQQMRSRQRSVNDVLVLQQARVEWEQRQAEERTRMMDKLQQHPSQGVRKSTEAQGKSAPSGSRARARSIDWQQMTEAPDAKRSRPRAQSRQSTNSTKLAPPMPTNAHHAHRKSVAF